MNFRGPRANLRFYFDRVPIIVGHVDVGDMCFGQNVLLTGFERDQRWIRTKLSPILNHQIGDTKYIFITVASAIQLM